MFSGDFAALQNHLRHSEESVIRLFACCSAPKIDIF